MTGSKPVWRWAPRSGGRGAVVQLKNGRPLPCPRSSPSPPTSPPSPTPTAPAGWLHPTTPAVRTRPHPSTPSPTPDELEDVEPAAAAVHRIHDAVGRHVHVVDLDRADGGACVPDRPGAHGKLLRDARLHEPGPARNG